MLRGAAQPGAATVASESQQIRLLLNADNADNAAAIRRSRLLVAQARRQNQPAALAEGYWLLGSALRNQSRFDSSLYYGQRALTLFQELKQPEGQANAYALLAQNYKCLADVQHVRPLTCKAVARPRSPPGCRSSRRPASPRPNGCPPGPAASAPASAFPPKPVRRPRKQADPSWGRCLADPQFSVAGPPSPVVGRKHVIT